MTRFIAALSLFVALCGSSAVATAANPRLMLPAACAPGQDCWVVNYVDMDPAAGSAKDYTCGPRTYDGHDGTDIAVRDTAAFKAGVSVLAAAPGIVQRTRDTQPDKQPTKAEIDQMMATKHGCGNGVLVDHGDGWQTIYCHMKSGSIAVKPGDKVTAGQKLGEIGQSGAAEFPHVQFGVFKDNKVIDPFAGSFAADGCGKVNDAMWETGIHIDYEPMSIFATGFTTTVPDFEKIREDTTSKTTTDAKVGVLAYWVGIYGAQKGDRIKLNILDPAGKMFATQSIEQKETRARQFYFVGRRLTEALSNGQYRGTVEIDRPIAGNTNSKLSRNAEKLLTVTGNAAAKPQQNSLPLAKTNQSAKPAKAKRP